MGGGTPVLVVGGLPVLVMISFGVVLGLVEADMVIRVLLIRPFFRVAFIFPDNRIPVPVPVVKIAVLRAVFDGPL